MVSVPQLDFTSLDFVAQVPGVDIQEDDTTRYMSTGPSQPVQNLATAVFGLGQLLPITPPAPNTSWTLDFWGPALRCSDVEDPDRNAIWTNVWNSHTSNYVGSILFLAWAPWSSQEIAYLTNTGDFDLNLPFLQSKSGETLLSYTPVTSGGSAALYVAVLPQMLHVEFTAIDGFFLYYSLNNSVVTVCNHTVIEDLNTTISAGCTPEFTFTPATIFADATLLRCDLVNTSYSAAFDYIGGAQNVEVFANTTGHSPLVTTMPGVLGPSAARDRTDIMLPEDCSILLPGASNGSNPCAFDPAVARSLSYQGVFSAFNELVQGFIGWPGRGSEDGSLALEYNTSAMSTVLAQTEDLAFIEAWAGSQFSMLDLQSAVSNQSGWAYPRLANTMPTGTRGDLKSTLEQLFENLTFSLLAEPYLQ